MKMSKSDIFQRLLEDKTLSLLVAALLFSVITLGVTFGLVAKNSGDDKQYISLAGELRVLSQNIVKNASEASSARVTAFPLLKESHKNFNHGLGQLRNGDPELSLPASSSSVEVQLTAVTERWKTFGENADDIFQAEGIIRQLSEFVNHINNTMPNLLALSDEVVGIMIEIGSNAQQVYIASRQLMLSQRMSFNVNKILQGGQGAATAADRFGRDAALFGRVLAAMLKGNPAMSIKRISDPDARDKLEEVSESFAEVSELVGRILEKTPELFKAQDAANNMFSNSEALLAETTNLMAAYGALAGNRVFLNDWTGSFLGFLSLVLLIALAVKINSGARNRQIEAEETSRANQEAILQLLEEIADLADGDLTKHATVTESFTGAIADAMNFAIDALRQLVTTINETTVQVSSAAQETQATAMHLAEASDHQAQQITAVSAAVNQMAASIEQVSNNASSSTQVAQQAVSIANKGSVAVQDTINGMDSIRENIQETSKRIKRLGESSQEIGDIIELINDIADQTNILALNAAIQAAMAGDAGRGFAVVADEVQRLAERSTDATKQIEGLVRTIQSDTKEAVASMEQSTSGVVQGAKLAQRAGEALEEIETVSTSLAEIIQNITDAAQQQSTAATSISETMNVIQEVTTQTSAGTSETATSIGNLAELANELRKSVAGFALPN
ncbi:MAG: chemotaxis protein [Gammaproteobacteria bacterium]|nr:chemotaxis protein [Gammaproteobacteria bacterium]